MIYPSRRPRLPLAKNSAPARRRRLAGVCAGLALLALMPVPAMAQTVEVRMQGEKFVPETITIKPGTTVRWINTEKRTSHSVHFAAEGMPESERMFPGESWQRKFDQPGRYPYVCGPHPHMKGVVEVVQ